jgi:hypothetical protein
LHGGDAWVDDAPGGGARVIIELPAAARASGFTDEHPSASSAAASEKTLESGV